ncbi:MAG: PDZ domain-containing protein [Kiritimatiellia bacterium]
MRGGAACGLLLLLTLSRAETPSPPGMEQVSLTVTALKRPEYAERVQARRQIEAWSEAFPRHMLNLLAKEYSGRENPEILYQLHRQLRELAAGILFFHPPAFLGVNFEFAPMPDGRNAIRIESVLPGSAAENAGLRAGDFLVEVGGVPVENYQTPLEFSLQIQERLPLESMTLRVYRRQEFYTDVRLGSRELPAFQVEEFLKQETGKLTAWLEALRPEGSGTQPVGTFRMEDP